MEEEAFAPVKKPVERESVPGFVGDRLFRFTTMFLAALVLALLIGVAVVLAVESHLTLAKFGFGFFTSTDWDPVNEEFGALPFIYGTVVSSAIALLIAVPLSLGVALCMVEMAAAVARDQDRIPGRVARGDSQRGLRPVGNFRAGALDSGPCRSATGALPGLSAAVPGPAHLAVSHAHRGVLLSVMVIPYITAVCTEVFRVVPQTQREAALALGATRWEMIRLAVIPYGYSGVVGAIMLGLGRALGETIAVAMVIGNRPEICGVAVYAVVHPGQRRSPMNLPKRPPTLIFRRWSSWVWC